MLHGNYGSGLTVLCVYLRISSAQSATELTPLGGSVIRRLKSTVLFWKMLSSPIILTITIVILNSCVRGPNSFTKGDEKNKYWLPDLPHTLSMVSLCRGPTSQSMQGTYTTGYTNTLRPRCFRLYRTSVHLSNFIDFI